MKQSPAFAVHDQGCKMKGCTWWTLLPAYDGLLTCLSARLSEVENKLDMLLNKHSPSLCRLVRDGRHDDDDACMHIF